MTERAHFKDRVRARMAKTGERYRVARMYVEDELLREDELEVTYDLASRGGALTAQEVAALERELEQTPHRLVPRIQLLGYYCLRRAPADTAARDRHVLWIIRHAPRSVIAGLPYVAVRPHDEGTSRYVQEWRARVAEQSDDATTLRHAGRQLFHCEPSNAAAYLRRAYAIEPTAAHARDLALQCLLYGDASEALSLYERHLDDDGERFTHLARAAQAAFAAGRDDKAVAYAEELIARAPHEVERDFVEGLHHGYILLGRVALRRGDVDGARRALLAAADAPRFFARADRTLADELTARGETDVVATYLARTAPR